MIKKHSQPENIKIGDHIVIIAEEKYYVKFINSHFLISDIKKTKDGRDYELQHFNKKRVSDEIILAYWTKKKYISVVHRREYDVDYYYEYEKKVSEPNKDNEHSEGLMEFIFDSILSFFKIFR
jgi:hypothetical protein